MAGKHFSFQFFRFSVFRKMPSTSHQNHNIGLPQRRRSKLIGFIIAEASAIGVLLLAGTFALSLEPAEPALAWLLNIVTLLAGAAVAVIPIIFFAIAPVLPKADR
jgi:hypothetical protein